jgi:hypothetical protein
LPTLAPVRRSVAVLAVSFLFLLAIAASLALPGRADAIPAARGGLSATGGGPATVPGSTATLVHGRAIPPADAPPEVAAVIRAANRIRTTPYIWGGGHGRWWSRGYDCSGAVSFALRGGRLLDTPMVSGSLARWGAPGPGRWITIYANAGHVYAEIAGLRWDTSGNPAGISGPRWHEDEADPRGFAVRHPIGY